jgi:hypothetical protein
MDKLIKILTTIKNYPVISFIILAIIYIILFSKKSKSEIPMETKNHMFNEQDGKDAVLAVKNKYGVDMARIVEKMLRWETGHFKSGQYKKAGSAGMEVGKWSNINPDELEPYTIKMHDADKTDGIDEFIVWKHPKYAALYLAAYIQRHKGNWARWNTTNEAKQAVYRAKVDTIKSKFV